MPKCLRELEAYWRPGAEPKGLGGTLAGLFKSSSSWSGPRAAGWLASLSGTTSDSDTGTGRNPAGRAEPRLTAMRHGPRHGVRASLVTVSGVVPPGAVDRDSLRLAVPSSSLARYR